MAGSGGSSITEQLIKNLYFTPEQQASRSTTRKAKEAVFALELTKRYDKSQILEWYLNLVNYGGVYDGVESAAEGYFGVHASQLDMAQSAMLAGIPQFPSVNSPYVDVTAAKTQ